MQNAIKNAVEQGVQAIEKLQTQQALQFIEDAVLAITNCYQKRGKLLIAGNGGSLCDAMHFAEELTGYFRAPRPALPAIALADPAHLTCVGNDAGFHTVFARGVEAYGQKGDVFIALSTSGNSKNLIEAAQMAKRKELFTIAFLGKEGGALKGVCDLEWVVTGFPFSDRIQEAHMTAIHIIIERTEALLFSEPGKQFIQELVQVT